VGPIFPLTYRKWGQAIDIITAYAAQSHMQPKQRQLEGSETSPQADSGHPWDRPVKYQYSHCLLTYLPIALPRELKRNLYPQTIGEIEPATCRRFLRKMNCIRSQTLIPILTLLLPAVPQAGNDVI
jgi:hypothetical protein